jgi:hypothetical protein
MICFEDEWLMAEPNEAAPALQGSQLKSGPDQHVVVRIERSAGLERLSRLS